MTSASRLNSVPGLITAAVLAAMAIGLLIALFQALTQIQESTLTFVPKMVVVAIVIGFSSTFIGNRFQIFTENVYGRIETGFRK